LENPSSSLRSSPLIAQLGIDQNPADFHWIFACAYGVPSTPCQASNSGLLATNVDNGDNASSSSSMSSGAIVGAVFGSLFGLVLLGVIISYCLKRHEEQKQESRNAFVV